MRFPIAVVFCAGLVHCTSAAITPDRYGALYSPGEVAVFTVPSGAATWRVTDCDDVCRGEGVVDGSRLELTETETGKRFGALRLEVVKTDGSSESLWFARLPSGSVRPCPWVGACTHPPFGWGHTDYRFVDLLSAAGIGIVRDEPTWANCELEKGVYKLPNGFAAYVNRLKERGIMMNMTLAYENDIYDDPIDPAAFARFAAWIAASFSNRVDRFEIWNEAQNTLMRERHTVPGDNGRVWIGKFIEFTQAADAAIRAVRPDAVVAVADEDVQYFLDMMITNGIAQAHNAISFHSYCHTQHRPEREYFLNDFGAKHKALAKAHGGADRWCVTESGWSTFEAEGDEWDIIGIYPKASYAGQAACLVRMYLSALEAGCEYACMYDFMNDGTDAGNAEQNFGLVHADGTPKPSFAAVAALTRLVGQATFKAELSEVPDLYRVASFVRGTTPILVAWCVEGTCEWELPENLGEPGKCYDLFGNETALPVVAGRRIRLTERPVYISYGPSVDGVAVRQDSATRLVTVEYTLGGASLAAVEVSVLTNGVPIGAEALAATHGVVSGVVTGGYQSVVWKPTHSWPGHVFTNHEVSAQVKVMSLNAMPDYLVFDLEIPSNIRYYETTADFPVPLGDDCYRTRYIVMRRIPAAGVLWRMGTPASEFATIGDWYKRNYENTHYVTLTKDYYMAVYELTDYQYAFIDSGATTGLTKPKSIGYNLMRGTGKKWPADGHELDGTGWFSKLRTHFGNVFAFDYPTEAQWEFACRAGTPTSWPNGKDIANGAGDYADPNLAQIAWYAKNADNATHIVGLKAPNAYGLYDMIGNVAEVCLDNVGGSSFSPYETEPATDPKGSATVSDKIVTRSGTHWDAQYTFSSGRRGSQSRTAGAGNAYNGIRLCVTLP